MDSLILLIPDTEIKIRIQIGNYIRGQKEMVGNLRNIQVDPVTSQQHCGSKRNRILMNRLTRFMHLEEVQVIV